MTFNNNTTLNLTIPAEKVTVQTQDQVGNPISGVTVTTQGSGITVNNLTIAPNITNAKGSSNYTQNNISPESNSQGNATLWLFPNTSSTEYTLFGAPPTNSGLAQVTLSNVLINNSNTTITMPFQEPTLSINGVLDDPLGNPLPGQQMYLASSTGGRTPIATTDSNGNFSLQAPAGTYTLTINSDPTTQNVGLNAPQSYTLSIPNFQLSQNTSNVDLTLPAKKVTVHVQNQFNNPVGNIAISTQGTAIQESNLSLSSTIADAAGSSNYTGSSLPSTDSGTGNATLWLFPTTSSTDYSLIATPPQNSSYAQFSLNNVNVTGDQTELVSLQYNHSTPVTTATLSPTPFSDGLYADPTTVTLSATAASGYTVANTYYTIDGGSQQTYSTPFTVTGAGNHTITYWSVDNSGVIEATNTKTFTITEAYSLSGTVYNDANQNGFQDPGEQGVAGATVTLNTGQSTTTDSNGNYTFSNLESGTYTETLTVPTGYSATTTNPVSVPLSANTTENFGIAQEISLVTAINAGGDTQGSFAADTGYSGGTTYSTTSSVDTSNVTNPAPVAVYQTVRYGNFTYTVPNLTPNTNYTLRLHFNELYFGANGNSGGVGSRVFNVSVNGTQALTNFDIYQAAGGADKALVEELPATSDSNGNITVQFTSVVDNAMVSGIEVDSGSPATSPTPTPTPIQSEAINAGGASVGSFQADMDSTNGTTYSTSASIDTSGVTNPAPEAVYQTVRYGSNFTYNLTNFAPNSSHTVRLHFSEPYWGTSLSSNQGGTGSRVFNVSINGTQVLSNFDVYQTAGGADKAVIEEFPVTTDSNGTISIQFTTVTDNAMVSGIEVN